VRATEGRFTFTRSLERWQDCELEDGFSIIWFEKLPEPKRRPPRKAPAPRPRKRGPKSYNIEEIEGIGPAFAARLRRLGIHTTDDLLKVAATRKGRQELALKSGFSTERILEWVNRADLMRVPGVGSEYSDLLEAGGVDTVKELRRRNAGNLHRALDKVNKRKKLVRRLPTLEEVQAWISAANKMKTIVKY
jgi:predicted flap endonuclease-1-like 5' DNA nuclease